MDRKDRIKKVTISPEITIQEAAKVLDRSGLGILLVCDRKQKLLGVITDGDIRRAILNSLSFDRACSEIMNRNPVSAQEGISIQDALFVMDHAKGFYINHLPITDPEGRVVDLLLRRDFLPDDKPMLQAVVMAGGFGKRLLPLTEDLPKPMIPVGEKPVLEHIINKLSKSGIKEIKIATNYLGEKIISYFGDGKSLNVNLDYINEENPLGTAGALSCIKEARESLLVINGDILTDVDFARMFDFHREQKADLTIGVKQYEFQVPYGVIQCNGYEVNEIHEKPLHNFFVNAGIYILQSEVLCFIPKEQRFDMTDLIKALLKEGKKIVSFPVREYWIDIGRPTDLEKAQKDYASSIEQTDTAGK